MSFNVDALQIDQLTVGQRLDLIELIWDSLPAQIDSSDLPAWHRAELAKRRATAKANPGIGKQWRELLDQLGSEA
jgi:putative addiction module component (TIGR02574 family)